MFRFAKYRTKALIDLHGWNGLFLGLLLYAIVFTGAIAVLSQEIGIWSVGGEKSHSPFSYPIDTVVSELSKKVKPEYLEEVMLSKTAHGDLQAFFHTHKVNSVGVLDDYGIQFDVDVDTGEVLQEQTGFLSKLSRENKALALSHFVVDVHTELHLPRPWGLLITGILGLSMVVAGISGLFIHRHIFADIFVLRRQRSPLLEKRDIHAIAGTWGLPFVLILGLTGSFFSFAGAFGLPAMAKVAFGGDQEAMLLTLVGVPSSASEKQAQMSNIDYILKDSIDRAGSLPESVAIVHYGRDDAKVLLFHPAKIESLEPVQLEYNGVSGAFNLEKPSLGTVPSAGSTAFSVMVPLHFGHFLGVVSKLTWVCLGFTVCHVVLSGLLLWLKRRESDSRWKLFERVYIWVSTGLPLSISASAIAYFLNVGGDTVLWVSMFFLATAGVAGLLTLVVSNVVLLRDSLLVSLLLSLFCLPVLRLLSGGMGWLEAYISQNLAVVMIDVLLLLAVVYIAKLLLESRRTHALQGEASVESTGSMVTPSD